MRVVLGAGKKGEAVYFPVFMTFRNVSIEMKKIY